MGSVKRVLGVGKLVSGDSSRGIPTSPFKLRAGTGKRKDRLWLEPEPVLRGAWVGKGQKITEQSGHRASSRNLTEI